MNSKLLTLKDLGKWTLVSILKIAGYIVGVYICLIIPWAYFTRITGNVVSSLFVTIVLVGIGWIIGDILRSKYREFESKYKEKDED